jgi:hypothetical protein
MRRVIRWVPLAAIGLLGGWAWVQGQLPDYDDPTTARGTGPKMPGSSQYYELG